MKLSDYIVQWLSDKGIQDFYGYQGTMIAHFVDSISKNGSVKNHSCYNEQGAAFAACGHAVTNDSCSVAYATSGPGAINLVSGIANAYYDSIPVIFITGQINTYEYRRDLPDLRQNAFQETKIVEMSKVVTKYAVQILEPEMIRYELEKAYHIAMSGRRGPVLLDIPMNIQRADIEPDNLHSFVPVKNEVKADIDAIWNALKVAVNSSERPVLLLGNGIRKKDYPIFLKFSEVLRIPVVTSLLAKGCVPAAYELNFGYLGGAYGHRAANLIASLQSDQLIAVGISLCTRQTGVNTNNFAKQARILRYDIDPEELKRKINDNETSFIIDTSTLANLLVQKFDQWNTWKKSDEHWISYCKEYKKISSDYDNNLEVRYPNKVIDTFNTYIKDQDIIVSDVGQHMMWVAQSIKNPASQPMLFSGGHGAMGFALPASIGAYMASPNSRVFCFCGDGAFQMNIQELQWLLREQCNVVIIVLNNKSLGLITQQQDAYFDRKHYGADYPDFTSPKFADIAKAYGIKSVSIHDIGEIPWAMSQKPEKRPFLIEFIFDIETYALPKTRLGQPIFDQEPKLPDEIFEKYINNVYWR